jgi:hypothetical protein
MAFLPGNMLKELWDTLRVSVRLDNPARSADRNVRAPSALLVDTALASFLQAAKK